MMQISSPTIYVTPDLKGVVPKIIPRGNVTAVVLLEPRRADTWRAVRFVAHRRDPSWVTWRLVVRFPRQRLEPSLDPVENVSKFLHVNFLTFLRSLGINHLWSRAGSHLRRFHGTAKSVLLAAALGSGVSIAMASDPAGVPQNVFATALVDGYAATPAPLRSPAAVRVLESLQAQSGSKEPISLVAQRIVRFTQQTRCGRVRFALAQPAAKKVWPAFGGQMNVCEDGQPPLRTCPERVGVLVPATSVCAGGKPPVDTEEVAAAIRAATSAGAITHDQMLHDWFQKINAHSHAPLTTSPSSAAGVGHVGAAK